MVNKYKIVTRGLSLIDGLNAHVTNSFSINSFMVNLVDKIKAKLPSAINSQMGSSIPLELIELVLSVNFAFFTLSLLATAYTIVNQIAIKIYDFIQGLIILYHLNIYLIFTKRDDVLEFMRLLTAGDDPHPQLPEANTEGDTETDGSDSDYGGDSDDVSDTASDTATQTV